MPAPSEGYVLHTYGDARYLRHAVASVVTLRRHDASRPVALFCSADHQALLRKTGQQDLFDVVEPLPSKYASIVGFKHNLHRFVPFDRVLFLDSDMIWCRNPDPLWQRLSTYAFTATGLDKADFFFGGPKGPAVIVDFLLNRRRRTMRRFGLTHLPRVQAGMLYSQDHDLAREVCQTASRYLARRKHTHFRSRLDEGRSEETCEWSLAMAMSRLELPIFPWFQGYDSPQLDFVEGLTSYDDDFTSVRCRYYCDPLVYSLRGLHYYWLRDILMRIATYLPGRNDFMDVTPFALHFGWLHHKQPFYDFAARTWTERVSSGKKQLQVGGV